MVKSSNLLPHFGFPSREAIAGRQLEQLRKLLCAVAAGNRFYAPRLRQAGLAGELRSLDDFFRDMPFTRKEEIVADQQAHPPYGTNLTFPLAAYNRFTQTSATSGAPLRWLDTPESWQWMLDNWKQVFAAAEVGPADAVYFAFSFGPFLGFWTAFEAACQMGCRCLPGGGLSSLARLQGIRDNAVDALCCTPTYALHLGRVAAEGGSTRPRSPFARSSSPASQAAACPRSANRSKGHGPAPRSSIIMA